VRDEAGKPVGEATIRLHLAGGGCDYTARTSASGKFVFAEIGAGNYALSVENSQETWKMADPVVIREADNPYGSPATVFAEAGTRAVPSTGESSPQATGGEDLSSGKVSSLPLNARDFSKLLLLAAGTMTDANGAANFTQQFAVNGQTRVRTDRVCRSMELTPRCGDGGATFSNFNIDAIQKCKRVRESCRRDRPWCREYTNLVTSRQQSGAWHCV